jgi:hypothetical protein
MVIYIHNMECSVLFTDEFESWWNSFSIEEQECVTYSVDLLARLGIELKFSHSSGISGSRYPHMRELRIQHGPALSGPVCLRPPAECRAADGRRQDGKRTVV